MADFTPFLLELGLAKSQAALVWLAPPLSGMIVQPIVGTLSDSSTSRWGRRRSYLVPAAFIATICLLTLGWASDICHHFFSTEVAASQATVALAVFGIYALDFAINCVQSTARSLIVDTLPLHQQQIGSAWAGRMLAFGTLLGYLLGTIDLQTIFGDTIGNTQFKRICVITSIFQLFCILITSIYVKEHALPARR
jgi:solute carrier family 45, member 1/2/4